MVVRGGSANATEGRVVEAHHGHVPPGREANGLRRAESTQSHGVGGNEHGVWRRLEPSQDQTEQPVKGGFATLRGQVRVRHQLRICLNTGLAQRARKTIPSINRKGEIRWATDVDATVAKSEKVLNGHARAGDMVDLDGAGLGRVCTSIDHEREVVRPQLGKTRIAHTRAHHNEPVHLAAGVVRMVVERTRRLFHASAGGTADLSAVVQGIRDRGNRHAGQARQLANGCPHQPVLEPPTSRSGSVAG